MPHNNEDKNEIRLSPLAIGYMWSTRIISLSIEMGIIILGFHWLDKKFSSSPIFIIIGSMLAIGIFFLQLLGMSKKPFPQSEESKRR